VRFPDWGDLFRWDRAYRRLNAVSAVIVSYFRLYLESSKFVINCYAERVEMGDDHAAVALN
jgi:hypothetical protein